MAERSASRTVFWWWFKWGSGFMALLAVPWIFLAGSFYCGARAIRLQFFTDVPKIQDATSPMSVRGLAERLTTQWMNIQPRPLTERPEVEILLHKKSLTRWKVATKVCMLLTFISWMLCTAALFGVIGVMINTRPRRME